MDFKKSFAHLFSLTSTIVMLKVGFNMPTVKVTVECQMFKFILSGATFINGFQNNSACLFSLTGTRAMFPNFDPLLSSTPQLFSVSLLLLCHPMTSGSLIMTSHIFDNFGAIFDSSKPSNEIFFGFVAALTDLAKVS